MGYGPVKPKEPLTARGSASGGLSFWHLLHRGCTWCTHGPARAFRRTCNTREKAKPPFLPEHNAFFSKKRHIGLRHFFLQSIALRKSSNTPQLPCLNRTFYVSLLSEHGCSNACPAKCRAPMTQKDNVCLVSLSQTPPEHFNGEMLWWTERDIRLKENICEALA